MFWKAWKPNQQAMPAAQTRPKTSSARRAMTRARQMTRHSSAMRSAGAEQAELLAGDGEHEVGLLLGHEAGPGLRAVEQSLAEQAAVADRDPGLLDVVAGAARVERGVDEGQEAIDLVGLQHAGGHRGDGRRRRRPPTSTTSQRRRGTGDGQHAEDGGAQDEHGAQVGLQRGSATRRHGGDRQHQRRRRRRRRTASRRPSDRSASTSAMPDDHRELRELRGLDRQTAQPQPRLRPVDRRAHRQHQDQAADRGEVDERTRRSAPSGGRSR